MKLSNVMRDQIVVNAVETVFKERREALAEETNALAMLGYQDLYPEHIQAKIYGLPEDFFVQHRDLDLVLGGHKVKVILASSKRFAACHSDYGNRAVPVVKDSSLWNRATMFDIVRDRLKSDVKSFEREMSAFLISITTTEMLKKSWPEGEPYYSPVIPKEAGQLPAILPERINTLISTLKAA